jgi:hypothetical protein
MLRLSLIFCAFIASVASAARPMIIHESQRIDPPAGYDYFAYSVGVDGDWGIIQAIKYDTCCSPPQTDYALLYRHDGVRWNFDRVLLADRTGTGDDWTGNRIAMSNGLVALEYNPLHVFRRSGSSFTPLTNPFPAPQYSPDAVNGFVKWSGNTLFAARRCRNGIDWGGMSATLNADGSWTQPMRLSSNDTYCLEEPIIYDFSGNTVTAATWSNDYEQVPDTAHVFKFDGTGWMQSWSVGEGQGTAAVRGNEVFVPHLNPGSTQVFRNDGSLTVVDRLRTLGGTPTIGAGDSIATNNSLVVQSGSVFRKNAAGKYEHVALLVPREADSMGQQVAISERRLLVSGSYRRNSSNPAVFAFDLPEVFVPSISEQFSFESGNAGAWTPTGGQFTVATSDANHVYRQSSVTGDARSVLSTYDWQDQSIEADIRPTAFSGADRWAGLAVRYLDQSNYYYVTLRNSGYIELRKNVNGAFSTLARQTLGVVAGRNYHVSLLAMGTAIRVNVDGVTVLWTDDASLTHGRAALVSYRTQVDYDNLVVGQLGQTTIYDAFLRCHNDLQYDLEWTRSGAGQWGCPATGLLSQTSTAGDARAVVGTPTDDQVVRARARATAFAAPSGTQERWFGLATRYIDSGNFYYLSLRNSNTVSLRKVVNGVITVLGTAPLNVAAGTWFDLRLDAVGSDLRAFVNGRQVLQANDGTHSTGQSGAVTFKAAADFQNLLLWQP